ncbi:MAG: ribbon-helix-helix protein, CopG family [Actinomycetes bacterium]
MAMTLRLSDVQQDALRRQAEAESTSMHEIARRAIGEYLNRHADDEAAREAGLWAVERYRSVLDRLA